MFVSGNSEGVLNEKRVNPNLTAAAASAGVLSVSSAIRSFQRMGTLKQVKKKRKKEIIEYVRSTKTHEQ
jgi:hypothetical protein